MVISIEMSTLELSHCMDSPEINLNISQVLFFVTLIKNHVCMGGGGGD